MFEYTPNHLDLIDREHRVFTAFQTAIALIDPQAEREPLAVAELLELLLDEYRKVREDIQRTLDAQGKTKGRQ